MRLALRSLRRSRVLLDPPSFFELRRTRRPVEGVEALLVQARPRAAVHRDQHRVVRVLRDVRAHNHRAGRDRRGRIDQASLDPAEDAGRVLQKLRLVLLPEHVLRQRRPRLLPLLRREVRVRLAREGPTSVVRAALPPARPLVEEPVPAEWRRDLQAPAPVVAQGRPDVPRPDVERDPGRLVQHQAAEAETEDRIRVVGAEEEHPHRTLQAVECRHRRGFARERHHVAAEHPQGINPPVGDQVRRCDPAVVPRRLRPAPVEDLGGGEHGLPPPPAAAHHPEPAVPRRVDGELAGVRDVREGEVHGGFTRLAWAGPAGCR